MNVYVCLCACAGVGEMEGMEGRLNYCISFEALVFEGGAIAVYTGHLLVKELNYKVMFFKNV